MFCLVSKVTDASTLPPTPVTSVGLLQHIGFLYGAFEGGSLPSTNEQGADGGTRQTSEVQVLLDFICFGSTITFFVILKRGLMTLKKKYALLFCVLRSPKSTKSTVLAGWRRPPKTSNKTAQHLMMQKPSTDLQKARFWQRF